MKLKGGANRALYSLKAQLKKVKAENAELKKKLNEKEAS